MTFASRRLTRNLHPTPARWIYPYWLGYPRRKRLPRLHQNLATVRRGLAQKNPGQSLRRGRVRVQRVKRCLRLAHLTTRKKSQIIALAFLLSLYGICTLLLARSFYPLTNLLVRLLYRMRNRALKRWTMRQKQISKSDASLCSWFR